MWTSQGVQFHSTPDMNEQIPERRLKNIGYLVVPIINTKYVV